MHPTIIFHVKNQTANNYLIDTQLISAGQTLDANLTSEWKSKKVHPKYNAKEMKFVITDYFPSGNNRVKVVLYFDLFPNSGVCLINIGGNAFPPDTGLTQFFEVGELCGFLINIDLRGERLELTDINTTAWGR